MSWLSTDYAYRKSITLSRATGEVTDYQMKLLVGESSGASGENVDCGGHCLSSFNDLRFTASDGTTLLDYWIESISGETPNKLATVWIKFNTIGTGATTFYMYYGNAAAAAVSNGANTFIVFDDFDGAALDAEKWTAGGGTIDVANSVASVIRASGVDEYFTSVGEFTPPLAARFKVKPKHLNTSYGEGAQFRDAGSKRLAAYYSNPGTASFYRAYDAAGTDSNILGDAADTWFIQDFYAIASDNAKFYIDNANEVLITTNVPTAAMYFRFWTGTANDAQIDVDWFLVRKMAAVEPAWGSWGAETVLIADLLNENCNDISDWTDNDRDTAVSEVDPAGQFRFDTNAGAEGNAMATRDRIIAHPPDQFSIEIKTYFDSIGLLGSDHAMLNYTSSTWSFRVVFSSGGLFIAKVGGYAEIGTDIVKCNGTADWQTWRFQVDKTAGEANATVEVFLENISQGVFDCDYEFASSNGRIIFYQAGNNTDNMVSHIDYIRIATGLGKIYDGEICPLTNVISAVDTFVAPALGNVFPPALSTSDTFIAPVFNMPRPVPALATTDTFVAPIFSISFVVPVMALVDTFVAPGIMHTILIPRIPTGDIFKDVFLSGVPTKKYCKFPNAQGRHISLKFESGDDDGGFEIYYIRHKMYQTVNLTSEKKNPNTQGTHISLELKNTADEAFTLEYVSEKMYRVAV